MNAHTGQRETIQRETMQREAMQRETQLAARGAQRAGPAMLALDGAALLVALRCLTDKQVKA